VSPYPDESLDPETLTRCVVRGGFDDRQVQRAIRQRFGKFRRRSAHQGDLHQGAGFGERFENRRKTCSYQIIRDTESQWSLQRSSCHICPDLIVHSKQSFGFTQKALASLCQFKTATFSIK
jgi:hypothetical protein